MDGGRTVSRRRAESSDTPGAALASYGCRFPRPVICLENVLYRMHQAHTQFLLFATSLWRKWGAHFLNACLRFFFHNFFSSSKVYMCTRHISSSREPEASRQLNDSRFRLSNTVLWHPVPRRDIIRLLNTIGVSDCARNPSSTSFLGGGAFVT